MMSEILKESNSRAKRKCHPDRLTAEPATLERLRLWQEQVDSHFKGNIRATRSEIINVLVQKHTDVLSASELQMLWDRCFDPVKFARSVAKKFEDAKGRGQNISMAEVIASLSLKAAEVSRPPRKRKVADLSKEMDPSQIVRASNDSSAIK